MKLPINLSHVSFLDQPGKPRSIEENFFLPQHKYHTCLHFTGKAHHMSKYNCVGSGYSSPTGWKGLNIWSLLWSAFSVISIYFSSFYSQSTPKSSPRNSQKVHPIIISTLVLGSHGILYIRYHALESHDPKRWFIYLHPFQHLIGKEYIFLYPSKFFLLL